MGIAIRRMPGERVCVLGGKGKGRMSRVRNMSKCCARGLLHYLLSVVMCWLA